MLVNGGALHLPPILSYNRRKLARQETCTLVRSQDVSGDTQPGPQSTCIQEQPSRPQRKKQHLTEKKKEYKATKEWKNKYSWVACSNPGEGMSCGTCRKWGKCPPGSKGALTTRGMVDWNHATELLRQHADSQWHRDLAATAAMAEQVDSGESVLQLQCSGTACEAAEQRPRDHDVLLKLLIAKN